MLKKIIIFLIILSVSAFAVAEQQQKAKSVLKAGDVEKFCKTFPKMSGELESLGMSYDPKSGEMNYAEAMKYGQKVKEILKKYGWDDNYFTRATAILQGYSFIKYGDEMNKATPEIEKAIKELDSNPYISEENKKQMKENLLASMKMMKEYHKDYSKYVHPDDLKLIKPMLVDIARVLGDIEEDEEEQE